MLPVLGSIHLLFCLKKLNFFTQFKTVIRPWFRSSVPRELCRMEDRMLTHGGSVAGLWSKKTALLTAGWR
jgi:hypothetical protein